MLSSEHPPIYPKAPKHSTEEGEGEEDGELHFDEDYEDDLENGRGEQTELLTTTSFSAFESRYGYHACVVDTLRGLCVLMYFVTLFLTCIMLIINASLESKPTNETGLLRATLLFGILTLAQLLQLVCWKPTRTAIFKEIPIIQAVAIPFFSALLATVIAITVYP
jgi:hypothetical protein